MSEYDMFCPTLGQVYFFLLMAFRNRKILYFYLAYNADNYSIEDDQLNVMCKITKVRDVSH